MKSSALPCKHVALLIGLLVILLIRLLSLGAYPLTDTTEARYGEMARLMVELNDWVTPWFDYGVPFWGKPPLAFWLSAAAARVMGASEFALRLPSFLLGLAMLGLVAGLARREREGEHAWLSAIILSSSALFFVASGAVLTDTALAFSITLAMAAFWHGVAAPTTHAMLWRYLLFVALGLGLLAKGPIALIFAGAPIGLWALLTRRLIISLRALPWVSGMGLMLLIAVPWYLIAEQHTPGFLDYFLIGENFKRFTDPHWTGDLYGNVHTRPYGYIWLLLLGAALPWSVVWLVMVVRGLFRGPNVSSRFSAAAEFFRDSPWRLYLLCFALTPALFFTLAGSVLATYLLPGMPALALLMTEWWLHHAPAPRIRLMTGIALVLPLLFALWLPACNTSFADKSQKALLAHLPSDAAVVYFPTRPFSGQFYSQGHARQAQDVQELQAAVKANPEAYLVTYAGAGLPEPLKPHYRSMAEAGHKHHSVLWAPIASFSSSCVASRGPDQCAAR